MLFKFCLLLALGLSFGDRRRENFKARASLLENNSIALKIPTSDSKESSNSQVDSSSSRQQWINRFPPENRTSTALLDKFSIKNELNSVKVILMWNAWYKRLAEEPFVTAQCPVTSCLFTADMSLMSQSDVIVLHFDTLEDFPIERQPHQRFVFYQFESPDNTNPAMIDDPRFRYNFFNWTMTYRRDSDIFLRDYYGSIVPQSNHQKTFSTSPNLTDLIKKKTKLVTWFVGHCSTPIRREEYVRLLSQYISVDVFGHCGKKNCPGNCDEMLRTEYKFYLAFENSWCPDYVTEKFARPFIYDAVPIVLGGADYSQFAPPHSYINARDFSSPKELADYLILLDQSDELYLKYFQWKRDYFVSLPDMRGWCDLCRMAHDETLPAKTYGDIKTWWFQSAGECETDSTKYF